VITGEEFGILGGMPSGTQQYDSWIKELETASAELAGSQNVPLQSLFLVRPVSRDLSEEEVVRLTPDQKLKFSKIIDPTRKNEWSESRRCHWLLERFRFKSLSHSKADGKSDSAHIVLAWGLNDPSEMVQGVGIDVELRSRAISDATSERFSSADERRLGITGLELWTAKEASFKANPKNEGTIVAQYQILSRDADGMGHVRGPLGEEIRIKSLALGPWQVSLALQIARSH
jgi:hypothetical protein